MIGLFIDFYDSFSANILAEFSKGDLAIEHYFWDDPNIESLIISKRYHFIVLGPGPGHITDYQSLINVIAKDLNTKEKKYLGFCLGHQMLCSLLGLSLKKLRVPLHGKSLTHSLDECFAEPSGIYKVQYYNSWFVMPEEEKCRDYNILVKNGMLIGLHRSDLLSYQFHPESVGTSCPKVIFKRIRKFLYNSSDVNEHKS